MSRWLKLIKSLYFLENGPCEATTFNYLIHINHVMHISANKPGLRQEESTYLDSERDGVPPVGLGARLSFCKYSLSS